MKSNLILIWATAVTLLWGCHKTNSGKEEKEKEVLAAGVVELNTDQFKMAGIEYGKISLKTLSGTIEVNGLISVPPQSLITITSKIGGYVKSTDLSQGSPVRKGQVVAVMENPDFIELQQNYLESKSQLEFAEAEYTRQKELYRENVNSAKTYQAAVANYKGLLSKVNSIDRKLAMLGIEASKLQAENILSSFNIYAPIDGFVKTANVNIGKYTNPTDVMFELINSNNLNLELAIYEKDISGVKSGQKISFTIPDKPGSEMSAVIYQVGKTINDDKTIKVFAKVATTEEVLLPGMFVTAAIQTGEQPVQALPDEAVVSFDDKNYIFIFLKSKKEDGKDVTEFKMIEVKKGVSNGSFTEVILPEGFEVEKSEIVVKGAYNLLAAMKNAGEMSC